MVTLRFADDDYHKRSRLDGALRSPPWFGGRGFQVLGSGKKDLLCLWVEGHRLRARLCLHRSGVFVGGRRLRTVDAQGPISARKEDQTGFRIKSGIVDIGAD